jgi:uncharacterized circularly permuted ATP-grasp superfamily protein
MFAQPPQTAKLKSILNQEPEPLVAQQKSQLSVALAALLWQIYSRCFSLQIHCLQRGHRSVAVVER